MRRRDHRVGRAPAPGGLTGRRPGKGTRVTERERKLWAVPLTVGGVITAFLIIAAIAALLLWII